MWNREELLIFQKYLFIILIPILILIGNIGSICNIIVFSRSHRFRLSPCSLYLIFASIGYNLYLNLVPLLRFLQISFNIDPSSQWTWFCKLRFYFIGLFLMLPRTYMLLATIDRYLMSKTIEHRLFSRCLTLKLIVFTCCSWMIISSHNLIFYNIQISSNGTDRLCSNSPGSYSIFLSFYSILINGLSMPLLMTIFGLLTLRNLRHHLRRIDHNYPIQINFQRRRKEEWSLLRMLLLQLIVTILLSLPITIYLCYNGLTQYLSKSSWRIFLENYIYNLLTILQYLNAAISFYVYSFTSRTFRREFFVLMKKYFITLKQYFIDHSTALFTRFNHSFTT